MHLQHISTVLMLSLFIVLVSASRYIPRAWAGICQRNISLTSTADRSRPAILVELRCFVKKTQSVQWKLNDLRDWIIDKSINDQTTPNNRTVIYRIAVMCETGANISLPWPMKAAGLVELRVSHCFLLDRYLNFMDPVTSTIDNDMKILEVRHSVWLLDQNNKILSNSGDSLNLTSEFDCGQDSSLETIVRSNVSDIIVADADEVIEAGTAVGELSHVTNRMANHIDVSGDFTSGWPAKPEDQLIKDTTKVVSDHSNLKKEDSDNSTTSNTTSTAATTTATTTSPKKEDTTTDSDLSRQAEVEYIKLMIQILSTTTKCNFEKLKVIDESIAPLTPLHHFELMVRGSDYPVLENMNYSYIGLEELPQQLAQWRIYFPKLTRLDISHNYLTEIEINNYPPTPGVDLVIFDARQNNITVINMDIIKSWAKVDNFFIDIRDNPIHCGCELTPLLEFLAEESIFTGKLAPYEYVKYLHCHTPPAMRGRQLYQLSPESLDCPVTRSNDAVIIILCVMLGFMIVVTIFVIKFKVEIRILLYTRLHVRLPCDTDIQRNNKTFDAFVSYSNDDAAWVYDNLVKFLETPNKDNAYISNGNSKNRKGGKDSVTQKTFNLCIHQRDFIPGKTIFDNIVDSIDASRHTIVVLSPSFMRSQWAMEELRQAYRQSLMEKTRHLIIILLEKVSKEEMDPLIRKCCKTFTYLEANDSLFKDRLVFSLTTKIRGVEMDNRPHMKGNKLPDLTNHNKGNVYDQVESAYAYDNTAHFNYNNNNSSHVYRSPEPIRELPVTPKSSTVILTKY